MDINSILHPFLNLVPNIYFNVIIFPHVPSICFWRCSFMFPKMEPVTISAKLSKYASHLCFLTALPFYLYLLIYGAVLCQCSLFLHPAVVLIAISAWVFLNLFSTISTMQIFVPSHLSVQLEPVFLFAMCGVHSVVIVLPNPFHASVLSWLYLLPPPVQ